MRGMLFWMLGAAVCFGDAKLNFAKGVLEEARGNHAAAGQDFEAAIVEDPLAIPLVQKVAGYRMMDGDRDGALELFQNLSKMSPDRLEAQLLFGEFMESEGGTQEAMDFYEKQLATFPGETVMLGKLLNDARERGDREKALQWLDQLRPDDPAAVEMYASGMKSIYDSEDPVAARKVDERYLEGFELHPDDRGLARATSEHFRTTGRMDEAAEVLRQHVQAAPWSLELKTRLGVLLFSAGRDEEGLEELKEVIAIYPKDGLAHKALAKYYRLHDDEAAARDHAAEVLKIRSGSAREFLALADEYLAANDPRSARLLLERAVFDYPGKVDLAMKLAIATSRDPESKSRAGRLIREAEAEMPEGTTMEPEFLVESAKVLREGGQQDAAEERLRVAIKTFPKDAKADTAAALRQLADWWDEQGKNENAAQSLRKRADALAPE
ncbi:tetratricopeptide repeat protein [Luteolibacter pohnpeiensis]|uniref:Tetratricopeptide repeat protein n=1 Tax=Luteolibacter pohnpeiensis TaxID=454153 RepID=A0A934VWS3_9BACT|nr:tetratricopeptide repeat protein [Luteolibacter pohnpeiensis]MBK1883103.1 tetratricopeptide repeat protein [Luteolibacter pohnpeiensis]